MRAVVVTSLGGPDVLELHDLATPTPGPSEVLVEVAAAGVNFIDIQQRAGRYPVPTPFTAGNEGAGTVRAVGDAVTEPHVGARVGWALAPGSYAELAVVRADRTVPVPDGVSDEQAAAVLLQGMTAHYLTRSTHPVGAGETVLVHAAAGGTGALIARMASLRGARVIGTVSTAEKEQVARAAGAHEVIRHREVDDLAAAVRLLAPQGVDAVYDGVGAATFDASLSSLRPRGMLVLFGAASGPVPPFDPQRLQAGGSLFLTRPTMAHYVATRDELLSRASDVFELVQSGQLPIRVGGRYPLAEAADAHRALESGTTTGKLVLLP